MAQRHWLFPASGAAYGSAFWYLSDYDLGYDYVLAAVMTFVAALAFCSWFAMGVRNLRDDIAFCAVVPTVAALQVFGFQQLVGFEYVDDTAIFGLLISQALWVGIVTSAWRIWMPVQTTVLPNHADPSALVSDIWSIKLSMAFGLLAVGILWPVLWALITLFELVGLTGIEDILTEGWVAAPLSGAACATGILIAREKSNLLIPIRQVIGGMFRVLYPIQALGLFVFLIAAIFGGWETLIAQEFGVWWTVMSAAAGLSYLLFGTVQANDGTTLFGRIGDRIFRVTLWMAPLFGALAIYTIWLRVSDYGLTPSRVYGIWAALFVLFATIWLAVAAFGRRQSTPIMLRKTFGHIAMCLAMMAFVIHLPLMDPISMSARSQSERVQAKLSGQTSTTEILDALEDDLVYLAGELGNPGEDVIADVTESHEAAIPTLADLRAYRAPEMAERMDVDDIPIYPPDHGMGDDTLAALLEDQLKYDREYCRERSVGAENVCAVLLVDLDRDGVKEAVFFNNRDFAGVYAFDASDDNWRLLTNLQVQGDEGDRRKLIEGLASGAVELIAPRFSDLRIGGIEFRQYP